MVNFVLPISTEAGKCVKPEAGIELETDHCPFVELMVELHLEAIYFPGPEIWVLNYEEDRNKEECRKYEEDRNYNECRNYEEDRNYEEGRKYEEDRNYEGVGSSRRIGTSRSVGSTRRIGTTRG
ncbi:hypothetical protein J6590_034574 [Homalodisca vitripennis]|nr:hypothetical protein J6590_034574 [Homalodisca vitripennis]